MARPRIRSIFPFTLLHLVALGCTPGAGAFTLEELRGLVVDSETGDPIAGAEVVEWYVGGGPSDGEFATSTRDEPAAG